MNKFKAVCATQLGGTSELGGPLGLQLWGVAENGDLWSTFQKRTNGPWEKWSNLTESSKAQRNWFATEKHPSLTAAQNGQGEGGTALWTLDFNGDLIGTGGWGQTWDYKWQTAPMRSPVKFAQICVCEPPSLDVSYRRQLWAVGRDNCLYYSYEDRKGTWSSPWGQFYAPVRPGRIRKVFNSFSSPTAAQNSEGGTTIWALDCYPERRQNSLKSRGRGGPDGADWTDWQRNDIPVGSNGRSVYLAQICVCKQGGSLGRALWGVEDENGELWWRYEQDPRGGKWTDWKRFPGPGTIVKYLTAARQNDGRVALWAISKDNVLYNNIQRVAGRDNWAGWDRGGTRQQDFGIIDEIETTLARKPDGNEKVTYLRTSGNKFTRLDTPGLWGPDSTRPARESPARKKLLDSITEVIGNATQILDLTFLYNPHPMGDSFPDGDFQTAISKGFETLISSSRRPSIRILFGVPLMAFWRHMKYPVINPVTGPSHHDLMAAEKTWLQKTIEATKKYNTIDMKCPILLAHGKSTSWNHTKIIVADDKIAITGGHNFWDDDYLGAPPTHDVSGVFEGPTAKAARLFCDKLWTQTAGSFSLIEGQFAADSAFKRQPQTLNTGTPGHLEMLSLGRLGKGLANFSISSNASVTARIVALCKAKETIRISQQSLRALTLPGAPPMYDFYTCLAIVRAVRAGVNVKVVLSGQFGKGYGGEAQKVLEFLQLLYLLDVLPADDWRNIPRRGKQNEYYSAKCHAAPQREDINGWVDLAAGAGQKPTPIVKEQRFDFKLLSDKRRVYAELNRKLKLATLYNSDNSQSSNHSKVYIIDEDCFYVGSDNMYPSLDLEGLQEFGYLIEDQKETKKFQTDYWDKLWEYSQKHALN